MIHRIKLFDPVVGKSEEKQVSKVLKSNFWASGSGVKNVLKFENSFKKYISTNYCVALNSGTAALHLALSLFDIKNKEVILPSLSFISTAHAVIYNGGKPVFVDVDPKTMCIDPELIPKKITKKTRVILPVHFAGMPSELEPIQKLCKNNNFFLVEDAAHAVGAYYKKNKIGAHGDAVCFSFHPVKNLAMPNGGAITLNQKNSSKLQNILRSRRWCGIFNRKNVSYDVTELGWNYYMNEFSAVIGLVQLHKLDKMNNIRRKFAKRYSKEINVESKMPFNENCSYHFYWILVSNRDKFMKKMKANGIETGIHYKPIHNMRYYKSSKKLPITELAGNKIVSLPIHPNLSEFDVNRIIRLVNKFAN